MLSKRRLRAATAATFAFALAASACGPDPSERTAEFPASPAPASATARRPVDTPEPASTEPRRVAGDGFVGSAACAECHAEETAKWSGSHHDLAMQPATAATVLGDFDGASLRHHGRVARFFSEDGKFFVETEDAKGDDGRFEVLYTFGVDPLQQYLVSIGGGRLQALPFAWDARPAEQGGGRWYHLYADETLAPEDPLYWTNANQNWNYMCAQCHSTDLKRNYRAADRGYATTWSEIDVACEACHGPAAAHVAWAGRRDSDTPYDRDSGEHEGFAVELGSNAERRWVFAAGARIARLATAGAASDELQVCAPCHARRSLIDDEFTPGEPLLDAFRLSELDEGLYYADGQIHDEVYVYGSFLQSKMYAAGVVCSDCHDPHSLAIADTGAICLRCHAADVFAQPGHTHHDEGSGDVDCVDCHMPARTYMGVDVRRDHAFRVPRPDLSQDLAVPNACNACHGDRSAQWATDKIVGWFPDGQTATGDHFARAITAGRAGEPGAASRLLDLIKNPAAPAIVRATAVSTIGPIPSPETLAALRTAVVDEDPLVRVAAARAAASAPPQYRAPLVLPLLDDPVRAVRIGAARSLAAVPQQALPDGARGKIDTGLDEYADAERANQERAESRTNLGTLAALRGRSEEATAEFREAVAIDPTYVPAYVNWADLLRALDRDAEGERVLRNGLEKAPDEPALRHALGLLLHRTGRNGAALDELEKAAEAENAPPRYSYAYALAMSQAGDPDRALAILRRAHEAAPNDAEILFALATISRDVGDYETAIKYAEKLERQLPGAPAARELLDQLKRRSTLPAGHPPIPGAAVR